MFSIWCNDATSFLRGSVSRQAAFQVQWETILSLWFIYFIGKLYFKNQCILARGDHKQVALIYIYASKI